MTPIEIIATIFALLIIIKFLCLTFKPSSWKKFSDCIVKNPERSRWIYLILAVIVGKYLLDVMDIVQIAAVMLFTSLLIGFSFFVYTKEFRKFYDSAWKHIKTIMRKSWLVWAIYLVIAVWVLVEIFGQ